MRKCTESSGSECEIVEQKAWLIYEPEECVDASKTKCKLTLRFLCFFMLLIVQMLAYVDSVCIHNQAMGLIRTSSLCAISIMTDFVATRRLLMHVCACSCSETCFAYICLDYGTGIVKAFC